MAQSNTPPEETSGIPGHWVILGILVFAVAATAFEWNYLRLHRMPFIPLREAIAKSFGREVNIKIDGGRPKRGPMTLRIVIDVPFDPLSEKDQTQTLEYIQRLEKLAREQVNLEEYEFLQIYLVKIIPEATPRRREHRRPTADVLAEKPVELTPAEKKPDPAGTPLPELTK